MINDAVNTLLGIAAAMGGGLPMLGGFKRRKKKVHADFREVKGTPLYDFKKIHEQNKLANRKSGKHLSRAQRKKRNKK